MLVTLFNTEAFPLKSKNLHINLQRFQINQKCKKKFKEFLLSTKSPTDWYAEKHSKETPSFRLNRDISRFILIESFWTTFPITRLNFKCIIKHFPKTLIHLMNDIVGYCLQNVWETITSSCTVQLHVCYLHVSPIRMHILNGLPHTSSLCYESIDFSIIYSQEFKFFTTISSQKTMLWFFKRKQFKMVVYAKRKILIKSYQ